MTRLNPLLSALKVCDITYYQTEANVGPTTLGTSEPGTPTVSYTVNSSHYPIYSFIPYAIGYHWAYILAAGLFVTAGNISWKLKVNGVLKYTGGPKAVAANTYWTLSQCTISVVHGDVVDLYIWSNQIDSDIRWQGYTIQDTSIKFDRDLLCYNVIFTSANIAAFVLGVNPTKASDSPNYSWHLYQGAYSLPFGDSITILVMSPGTKGIYNTHWSGEIGIYGEVLTSATQYPRYFSPRILTKIQYRILRIDKF